MKQPIYLHWTQSPGSWFVYFRIVHYTNFNTIVDSQFPHLQVYFRSLELLIKVKIWRLPELYGSKDRGSFPQLHSRLWEIWMKRKPFWLTGLSPMECCQSQCKSKDEGADTPWVASLEGSTSTDPPEVQPSWMVLAVGYCPAPDQLSGDMSDTTHFLCCPLKVLELFLSEQTRNRRSAREVRDCLGANRGPRGWDSNALGLICMFDSPVSTHGYWTLASKTEGLNAIHQSNHDYCSKAEWTYWVLPYKFKDWSSGSVGKCACH